MYTTTATLDGKFLGLVRTEDERTLYSTPGFYTERMALAAAKCWVAFHGKDADMLVDPNEIYSAMRHAGTGFEWYHPTAQEVADRVANAQKFNLVVKTRTGTQGQTYITIGDGKGSVYGTYHIGAEFAAYVDEKRWNKRNAYRVDFKFTDEMGKFATVGMNVSAEPGTTVHKIAHKAWEILVTQGHPVDVRHSTVTLVGTEES